MPPQALIMTHTGSCWKGHNTVNKEIMTELLKYNYKYSQIYHIKSRTQYSTYFIDLSSELHYVFV